MPLYDYVCSSCGEKFEDFKLLKQRHEIVDCPKCGHQSERVLSSFAVGGSSKSSTGASCGTGWSGG